MSSQTPNIFDKAGSDLRKAKSQWPLIKNAFLNMTQSWKTYIEAQLKDTLTLTTISETSLTGIIFDRVFFIDLDLQFRNESFLGKISILTNDKLTTNKLVITTYSIDAHGDIHDEENNVVVSNLTESPYYHFLILLIQKIAIH